ncbi:MAG: AMP-binding protein, partial [bacterium]|nr:AMP-binding protein [bacterium]
NGYWKEPAKTAKAFIPNPYLDEIKNEDYSRVYKTGDIGYYHEDGTLECLGRQDYQVKIRGNRIEVGEIERRLIQHEDIKEAVVAAKDNEKNEKYLCAYIVTKTENSIENTVLSEYLKKQLPEYMIPSYFVQLEQIPLTTNGKIDRKALPDPQITSTEQYVPPGNETEKRLVEIWSEELGIEKDVIGIDDNFFQLGGHSLKATVIVTRIHKKLNFKLPLAALFRSPTIRGLAAIIKEGAQDKYTAIRPVAEQEYYTLSSAQKRMYVLQQMDTGSTIYNMPRVLTLEGKIDTYKIKETIETLIVRHESLRTSFEVKEKEPVFYVHKPGEIEFAIENFDITGTGEKQREKAGKIVQEFIRPFDLTKPPLLRAGIIKIAEKEHVLMVDLHHIITDGTSQTLLTNEFAYLYNDVPLPELKLQYKDYSQWQNSPDIQQEMKRQEQYWLKQFEKEPPVLEIPLDYERPEIQNFEGAEVRFEIEQKETAQLNRIAREQNATMFMVLLALYNVLLAKLSGQEEAVVGTGTAGRGHADLLPIIGMFVNTLALRNYPEGEKTFHQFLTEVKENTLQAFENQ